MNGKESELFEQARAAWNSEQWERSASLYEELLAAQPDAPESYAWWFDAALAYKFLRNWPKAYELGKEAAARAEPGMRDPAFWNLGIAATVLGDWDVARAAWRGYGITLPPGDDEIEADFGTACVRLDDGSGQRPEVVWARRICPTRMRVVSVPFGDRRFGEIVLHDGAPNGERVVDGRRYPVFDELMLWKPSQTPTFRARLSCPSPKDVKELMDTLDAAGLALEPVSALVMHPRAESEGSVQLNADPLAGEQTGEHDVLLAAPDAAAARALLETWAAAGPGRSVSGLRGKEPSILTHVSGHTADGAHPLTPHPDWPFPGGVFPVDLGVVAHRSLLTEGAPPRYVSHDADGWWQVLDGVSPADPEHASVTCMQCLVERHPELAALADLPPGWAAERAPDTPWQRVRRDSEAGS